MLQFYEGGGIFWVFDEFFQWILGSGPRMTGWSKSFVLNLLTSLMEICTD